MSGQMATALTPGSRGPWSHGQTTSSLRGANMLRNQDLLDPTSSAAKLFRRRFRVPHVFFLTLLRRVIEEGWFPTAEVDVVGRPCIPVTLKVSNFTQYFIA